jgi:cysteine synthase
MPESVSIERQKLLHAFGAEIILTPAKEGTDGAIRKARQIVADNPGKYFNPDQFSNPANRAAHYTKTAVEIWGQSEGKITQFVASLGTSGTLGGTSQRLKEFNPAIKVSRSSRTSGTASKASRTWARRSSRSSTASRSQLSTSTS